MLDEQPTSAPLDFEKAKEGMRENILKEWDNYDTKEALATAIMEGYIFGKYADNEHYDLADVRALVDVIYAEKQPKDESKPE